MKILILGETSFDIITYLNKNFMVKTRSYSTNEFHGGFWSKGQTWVGGSIIPSVNFIIGNITYKLKFIIVINIIRVTLKRIAIFIQSKQNKVGIMNLKLQSLL